jgi:hypothetical protein
MREAPFQAMLFETDDPVPDHLFYAATNGVAVKVGQTKDWEKRRKNAELRSFVLIRTIPCRCSLRRDAKGRLKCEEETKWEAAHGADRLPASEQYRPSADVLTALRFIAGRDRRAVAAVDWLRRYGMRATG